MAKKWDVEVMTGKANLEVRPTFINKGEIAKRLVADYTKDISHVAGSSNPDLTTEVTEPGKVEFVLCMGDDFTDEDMFRALNGLTGDGLNGSVLDEQNVFSVTVGASTKVTLAKWHVLEPDDVIESMALLAGVGTDGVIGEKTVLSQVNLAAVAGLEGRVPGN